MSVCCRLSEENEIQIKLSTNPAACFLTLAGNQPRLVAGHQFMECLTGPPPMGRIALTKNAP